MLPETLHIEQIKRYFEALASLGKEIDATEDTVRKNELSLQYFNLTQLWEEMDDMTEKIKDTLDRLDDEEE